MSKVKCTNCGASIKFVDNSDFACPYCGATYVSKKKVVVYEKEKFKGSNLLPFLLVGLCVCGVMFLGTHDFDKEYDENVQLIEAEVVEPTAVTEEFKTVVYNFFHKSYEKITDEQWNSVVSLAVMETSENFTNVMYKTAEGEYTFSYSGNVRDISRFVYHFSSLEELYINDHLFKGNAVGLENLTHLVCGNDIHTLPEVLSYPENLEYLSGVEYVKTMADLSCFENLKYLSVNCREVEDVSAIGTIKSLEELVISNDSFTIVKDYSFIGKLTNLKKLKVTGSGLYTIDFVGNLTKLEELKLDGTNITSIEPLKNNTNIKVLSVKACKELDDYEVVNTLTGLEELYVTDFEEIDVIDTKNLTSLNVFEVGK